MNNVKKTFIAIVVEIHSFAFFWFCIPRDYFLVGCLFSLATFLATLYVINWIEEQFDKLQVRGED